MMTAALHRIDRDPQGVPIKLYPFTRSTIDDAPALIVIDPTLAAGRPVLKGTGLATGILAERYKAGESVAQLARDYEQPGLGTHAATVTGEPRATCRDVAGVYSVRLHQHDSMDLSPARMPEYAQAVVDGWSHAELLRLHLHELPRSLMGLDRERRIELLAERPPMTGTPWDVLLAAMVEHVCELHDLEPPAWSQEPERFLDIPHFFTNRYRYGETMVYAPAAFLRHGALANARDLDGRGGEKHVWIPGSRPDPAAFR